MSAFGASMNRVFVSLFAATMLLHLPAFAGDKKTSDPPDKMTPQTQLAIMRDLSSERVFVRTCGVDFEGDGADLGVGFPVGAA